MKLVMFDIDGTLTASKMTWMIKPLCRRYKIFLGLWQYHRIGWPILTLRMPV